MFRFSMLAVPLAVAAGCAAIPESERILLNEEIDCSRADAQIAALEAAKPDTVREARILATSLTPAGLVLGAATADMWDRERVLSGAHAADLEARIEMIREACGLPPAGG